MDDISKRAIDVIKAADFIICENPKHSLKLLNNLGIKKKLISIHDYNEHSVIKRIGGDLKNKLFVLISDAGSPLISDPGYKLVQHCIKNKINITSIPGASSLIPALQLSGLPINEFVFKGFLPKTKIQISSFINKIKKNEKTVIFFVSSHRLSMCLDLMSQIIPNRNISISKELTKINEKIYRGLPEKIKSQLSTDNKTFKGEFVIVVGENKLKKSESIDLEVLNSQITKLLSKFSLTDVVEIVHKLSGITKNKVYKWVLSIKNI